MISEEQVQVAAVMSEADMGSERILAVASQDLASRVHFGNTWQLHLVAVQARDVGGETKVQLVGIGVDL